MQNIQSFKSVQGFGVTPFVNITTPYTYILGLSGLLAYYKFIEETGDTVADSSGNTVTGTWKGTLGSQWTTGKLNNGGNFNGTNNIVDLGTPLSLRFGSGDSFTIAGWYKRANTTAASIGLFGNVTPSSPFNGYAVKIASSHKLQVVLTDEAIHQVNVTSSGTINDTNWHYITVTYDGSSTAAGVVMYIDASVQTNTVVTNNMAGSMTSTTAIAIGAQEGGATPSEFFPGVIDEVAVFNRVLTAQNITDLYSKY